MGKTVVIKTIDKGPITEVEICGTDEQVLNSISAIMNGIIKGISEKETESQRKKLNNRYI